MIVLRQIVNDKNHILKYKRSIVMMLFHFYLCWVGAGGKGGGTMRRCLKVLSKFNTVLF